MPHRKICLSGAASFFGCQHIAGIAAIISRTEAQNGGGFSMNALRAALTNTTGEAESIGATVTDDPWRLDIHLMPPVGWLNDPNGLSYYNHEYHVFYQYGPFDPNGGIKFWGHYKSPDMLRWEMCRPMLYSDEPFDVHGAYSGSAIQGPEGLMMLYTGNVKHDDKDYDYILAGREQNTVLAVSRDGVNLDRKTLLMTNSDYPKDMTLHVRDPKVLKCDGTYYMVLGARTKQDQGVALVYSSPDLYKWTLVNTLRSESPAGFMWECPDLLEIDGHWYLIASPQGMHDPHRPGFENTYQSGYFPIEGDFRSQCTLGAFVPLDYGFDFYAPQTFWLPEEMHGRSLLVGWMAAPDADYKYPTVRYGWQHCLTQIREVTRRDDGRLAMEPIRELEALRTGSAEYAVEGEAEFKVPPVCEINVESGDTLELELSGLLVTVENGRLQLQIPEGGYGRIVRTAPVPNFNGFRMLVDTSAAEIFAEDGTVVLSTRWFPEGETRHLQLKGTGNVTVHTMRPLEIWQDLEERISRRIETEILT